MKTEPVFTVGGIGAAAAAVITLLVAFGVPLTDDQEAAILAVVAIIAPLVVAVIARRLVVPNAAVVEKSERGKVLAGEANSIPTGEEIRDLADAPDYQPRRVATED